MPVSERGERATGPVEFRPKPANLRSAAARSARWRDPAGWSVQGGAVSPSPYARGQSVWVTLALGVIGCHNVTSWAGADHTPDGKRAPAPEGR